MLDLTTIALRKDGCFSVLLWNGQPFAVSVERTFDNLRTVIGNGSFLCKRGFYDKGMYDTWEVMIEGHDEVLFHKGNLETHSLGCIITAESFGLLGGQTAVLDSKGGFEELMKLTEGLQTFTMKVTGRRN